MVPATYLAFMVGEVEHTGGEEERNVWNDVEVLRFLQTHQYGGGVSGRERDRIYRRAKSYR